MQQTYAQLRGVVLSIVLFLLAAVAAPGLAQTALPPVAPPAGASAAPAPPLAVSPGLSNLPGIRPNQLDRLPRYSGHTGIGFAISVSVSHENAIGAECGLTAVMRTA